MFLIKKLIPLFLYPFSVCLEIMIIGLIFLWFTRMQKAGKVLVTSSLLLFALFGYGVFSDPLLRPLEYKYPPVLEFDRISETKFVVVLGGGHVPDPRLSSINQLGESSTVRLIEGIRLYKNLPDTRLVLSGGAVFGKHPVAATMREAALALGMDENDIIVESTSRDTKDEARLIKNIVGKERFILVTSASHMPRSMALFEKEGLHAIPAPAHYLVKKRDERVLGPGSFFPHVYELMKTQTAIHEYLGIMWGKIRGQI